MKTVKFRDWNCFVEWKQYSNGRPALTLRQIETGEPIAVASINLPHEALEPDEIFIKDYSENEGMLDALVKAEIIFPLHCRVPVGHTTAALCRLVEVPNE